MSTGPLAHLPQIVIGYLLGVVILLIPIYLRARRPTTYRGFWKFWGDFFPSTQRFAVLILGGVAGLIVYVGLQLITAGGFSSDPFALGVAAVVNILLAVSFVYIVVRRLSR